MFDIVSTHVVLFDITLLSNSFFELAFVSFALVLIHYTSTRFTRIVGAFLPCDYEVSLGPWFVQLVVGN